MSNRVAFVTGASRGIGRAIALTLCRRGLRIVVASPEVENNEEVAAEIRALRRRGHDPEPGRDFARVRQGRLRQDRWPTRGRVDVLVNNAGITRDGLAVRMKPADWDLVLKINLHGAFLCVASRRCRA